MEYKLEYKKMGGKRGVGVGEGDGGGALRGMGKGGMEKGGDFEGFKTRERDSCRE